MNELISVIVPIYNTEKYLEKCLKSIIRQTYNNLEILLIDDGSTDKSISICERYKKKDSRIKLIIQKHKGVSNTRNLGIDVSKGEYIAFVDSDDWLEKNYIEELYSNLKTHNADIVKTGYYCKINDKKIGIENKKIDLKMKNILITNIINGNIYSYVWSLLIKKDILNKNNIRFKRDISYMEDKIFFLELIESNASLYFLSKQLYHHIINNEGTSKKIDNITKNINDILKVDYEIEKILKMHNIDRSYIEKAKTTHFNLIINSYFKLYKKDGNIKEIKQEVRKILQNKQFIDIRNKANSKVMSIKFKIQYWCIKKEEINWLLLYFKVRKIYIYIKEKMERKIEKN